MGGQGMGGQGMGGQGMGGQGMGGAGMGGQVMGGQGMGGQGMGGPGMGGQGMGSQGMGGQGMGSQGMGGPGMGGSNMNGGALSGGVAMSSGGQGQMQGRATPDMPMAMNAEGYTGTPPVQGQHGQMGIGGEFGMQVGYSSRLILKSNSIVFTSPICRRLWVSRCILVQTGALVLPRRDLHQRVVELLDTSGDGECRRTSVCGVFVEEGSPGVDEVS